MKKRMPIDQLKPGMYVVGMDKPWWQTPLLLRRRAIRQENDS